VQGAASARPPDLPRRCELRLLQRPAGGAGAGAALRRGRVV